VRRFGDITALDGVSFSVAPGQMFGFVGTNGAGKTTTMRIVLGVLEPDAGTVRWRGREIDADPDHVLDAARSAGTVTHFSLERPTLSDLFRAAVTA
jgi:ABC-type multidrug transport system ATPase subunit